MEISIVIITLVALVYLHRTIKNSVGYIETRSEVLKPMAELQNKHDLTELELELQALTKEDDK